MSNIKATEKNIQTLLMNYTMQRAGHQIAIPNITPTGNTRLVGWECDLFTIGASGYSNEYEIKLNRADYDRDEKKEKIVLISSAYENNKTIKNHQSAFTMPNNFYYVTYQFEIQPPVWAGWIYVQEVERSNHFTLSLEVKKLAPKLHGRKMGEGDMKYIARLLSYRLEHAYQRAHSYILNKDGLT